MTRATGQTVLQTLHFRQASALSPIASAEAAPTTSAIVIELEIRWQGAAAQDLRAQPRARRATGWQQLANDAPA